MAKDGDGSVTSIVTDISFDEDEGSKFVEKIGKQYSSLKHDSVFWEKEKDFRDLLKYNDETEIEYSNVEGKIINMRKDTSKFIQIYNILKNFFFSKSYRDTKID